MNFNPAHRRPPTVLELTPLIDVVFLLLIFFMVSTTFISDEGGLQVELPRSENRDLIPEGSDVALAIAADGAMELDGKAVDLEELKRVLRRSAEEDPNTMVVVRADRSLAHGKVVAVMDLVRELGLTHFAIATEGAGDAGTAPQ
jgi:biopolymer transport protein ExbD